MFNNRINSINSIPPPPPPPPRGGAPLYGGGLIQIQDVLAAAHQQQQQGGDWAQLAIRVAALEQMVSLQQQNNDIMLRLINALSSSASAPHPQNGKAAVAASTASDGPDVALLVVTSDEIDAEEASAQLKELTQNGVRRAAF